MSKKKRTILIIAIAAVIIIAAGLFGYAKYADLTRFEYSSMAISGEDYYLETISAMSSDRNDKKYTEEYSKYALENKAAVEDFHGKYTSGEYVKPTNIHASIEVKDGQTIFTYYGTATLASGETTQYNRQFTVDYVFTRDIPEVFKVPQK